MSTLPILSEVVGIIVFHVTLFNRDNQYHAKLHNSNLHYELEGGKSKKEKEKENLYRVRGWGSVFMCVRERKNKRKREERERSAYLVNVRWNSRGNWRS